jgi:hypothetical protein
LDGHAFLLAQQVDDVFLLLDVAGGDLGRLVDDVLAAHDAGDDHVLAVAVDADRSPGNSCCTWSTSWLRSRRTTTS